MLLVNKNTDRAWELCGVLRTIDEVWNVVEVKGTSMNTVTFRGFNNTIDGSWNFSGIKQTFVVSRKRSIKRMTLVVL